MTNFSEKNNINKNATFTIFSTNHHNIYIFLSKLMHYKTSSTHKKILHKTIYLHK